MPDIVEVRVQPQAPANDDGLKASGVDVVVENFKPGVMTDMGLSYDDLKGLKDDIILCSISSMGQTGPLARKPGYDYIAQSYAGVTSMIGDADEP